jgi:hypothetical protein
MGPPPGKIKAAELLTFVAVALSTPPPRAERAGSPAFLAATFLSTIGETHVAFSFPAQSRYANWPMYYMNGKLNLLE